MKHLVIMAAGTGGHIMPGLAVAQEMRSRGWSVSWLGTTTGMENRLVPPSGLPLDTINFNGLRGKGLMHALQGAARLVGAFWSCLNILRARGAHAVLGMGVRLLPRRRDEQVAGQATDVGERRCIVAAVHQGLDALGAVRGVWL